MNVWVTAEVTVGALDDGNRAALAVGDTPIRHALAVVGRYGVGEDAQDLAKQFPVEGERLAPHPHSIHGTVNSLEEKTAGPHSYLWGSPRGVTSVTKAG